MEARERLDRLDLYDDRFGDDKVQPISGVQGRTFVFDWERNLTTDRNASQADLVCETMLVGGLEKAGAKGPMNFQSRINNLTSNRVQAR